MERCRENPPPDEGHEEGAGASEEAAWDRDLHGGDAFQKRVSEL
jgi:hypothetical protein